MPLYEYECDQNHHRFEVIQKFSDPLVQICPTCGSPVHKLMSSPAIQFKGTGWYVTDYARKSGGGDAKSAKDAKDAKEGESKDSKDSKETKETKDTKAESATKSDAQAASSSSTPPASKD